MSGYYLDIAMENYMPYFAGTMTDGVIEIPDECLIIGYSHKKNGATYAAGKGFRITIDEGAGVAAPVVDNKGEATYYNLQGMPVEQPSAGTYIRVCGGKAAKVVLH